MTILVDGAGNPSSIRHKFASESSYTELSRVVCDNVMVWRRFPESLPTLTVTIGNSSTATIRNASCTGMYKDSSGWYAVYSADASIDLAWERDATVGAKNQMWNPVYITGGTLGTGWSCSGLPSGYSFEKWNIGSFSGTLKFYATSGSSAYSTVNCTLTQGSSRVDPARYLSCTPDPSTSYYASLEYYKLTTATAGVILQQSITFSIRQT